MPGKLDAIPNLFGCVQSAGVVAYALFPMHIKTTN